MPALRALSLTQPWATLVAAGVKRVETRSWATAYRGWLAIHAAKGFPLEARGLANTQPFQGALTAAGYPYVTSLPLGAIVAVARLEQITSAEHAAHALYVAGRLDEITFGYYAPGLASWWFDRVQQLREPVPCRGAPGLWAVPTEVRQRVLDQVPAEVVRGLTVTAAPLGVLA